MGDATEMRKRGRRVEETRQRTRAKKTGGRLSCFSVWAEQIVHVFDENDELINLLVVVVLLLEF